MPQDPTLAKKKVVVVVIRPVLGTIIHLSCTKFNRLSVEGYSTKDQTFFFLFDWYVPTLSYFEVDIKIEYRK